MTYTPQKIQKKKKFKKFKYFVLKILMLSTSALFNTHILIAPHYNIFLIIKE